MIVAKHVTKKQGWMEDLEEFLPKKEEEDKSLEDVSMLAGQDKCKRRRSKDEKVSRWSLARKCKSMAKEE